MEEKRRAVIHMTSVSPAERMETLLAGEGLIRDQTALLHWTERLSEDDGVSDETRVSLQVRQDHAMMQRRGAWAVAMVFEPGACRESVYHTPYGDLPLTVTARSVGLTLREDGGCAVLVYDLSLQGGEPDTRTMTLDWRWADADPGEG